MTLKEQTEIEARGAEEQLSEDDATPKPPLDRVEVDIELTFWDSVKDSDDLEMFEAYLEKYPDGEFRSLAEIRIAQLRDKK